MISKVWWCFYIVGMCNIRVNHITLSPTTNDFNYSQVAQIFGGGNPVAMETGIYGNTYHLVSKNYSKTRHGTAYMVQSSWSPGVPTSFPRPLSSSLAPETGIGLHVLDLSSM